ncbi:MAG: DUF2793 domain-containing protein [Methylocystis sp.]|nr:DUF2793 domain-containing protein [Methylocystis sp.]MCA3582511.1 DUF2793 domain-containing protein [Methylocystis sp.]MCA3588795.1 DUF2793 domain-containing protein [Methylocystis sp.]MCA3592869.1 DUF2793 domain-containing protein [Methylocystis sp.]
MVSSTRLSLPYLAAGQAQKHVTHNDALALLDALVQMSVLERGRNAPPASPAAGSGYIIGSAPTGTFAGRADQLAFRDGEAWTFVPPREGLVPWVAGEAQAVVYAGTAWRPLLSLNPLALLGVNATADAFNRLAVAAPSALLTHEGAGHRLKINKAAAAETASLLFQTGYSGRAELGLAGDDKLRFKASADGSAWFDAMLVEGATGEASFPATPADDNLLINGDFAINQRNFAGGALTAGAYGFDRWKADTGGASLSISAGVLTLTAGAILQVAEIPPGVGQRLAFSVDGLSGGNLQVTINGVTQAISPGTGRRGVTFSTGTSWTSPLSVRLSPAAGAVSFANAALVQGGTIRPYRPRPIALEMLMCQRYFQVLQGGVFIMSSGPANGSGYAVLPHRMRAAPAPLMVGSASANIFNIGATTVTAANLLSFTMNSSQVAAISFGSGTPATAANQSGFLLNATLQFSAEL